MDEDVERARRRGREALGGQKLKDALVAADEVVSPGVVVRVDGRLGVGVEVEVLKKEGGEREREREREREKERGGGEREKGGRARF